MNSALFFYIFLRFAYDFFPSTKQIESSSRLRITEPRNIVCPGLHRSGTPFSFLTNLPKKSRQDLVTSILFAFYRSSASSYVPYGFSSSSRELYVEKEGHPRGAIHRLGRVIQPNEFSLEFDLRFRFIFLINTRVLLVVPRWTSLTRSSVPDARFVKLALSALNQVHVVRMAGSSDTAKDTILFFCRWTSGNWGRTMESGEVLFLSRDRPFFNGLTTLRH